MKNAGDFIFNGLKEAKNNNLTRILIDCREVKFNITFLDRFEIGQHLANKARLSYKIAIIALNEQFDRKIFETAARNRGVNVLGFLNEREALDWLLT